MDRVKRLYTCECGNQKKPTDAVCETCLAKKQGANHAAEPTSSQRDIVDPQPISTTRPSVVDLQKHINQTQQRLQQQRTSALSTNPIHHLSDDLQQKLAKRAQQQAEHHRSSGEALPAIIPQAITPIQNGGNKVLNAPKVKRGVKKTPTLLGKDIETSKLVSLEKKDRESSMYIIGRAGSGKTTLLVNLILQSIEQGYGLCFLDPHEDATNEILKRLPPERETDVILLDLTDTDFAFGLNLFQCNDPTNETELSRVTSMIMGVFAKLFTESGDLFNEAPNLAETLQHAVPVLLSHTQPHMTMAEMPLLFTHDDARAKLLQPVSNPQVQHFWKMYDGWRSDRQEELTGSTRKRVNNFLTNPLLFKIIGQSETTLNFRQIMDEQKILLVKLSNQFELISNLIGSIIVGQLAHTAFSRVDTPEENRIPFFLYVDEFQNFATSTFAQILAETRKYKLFPVIAHQYRGQLNKQNRDATLNAMNKVVFQVSGDDAAELATIFDCSPILGEVRKEYKRTPIGDPIDYLVSGHTHPVRVVNEFCLKFRDLVRDAHLSPREAEQDTVEARQSGRRRTIIQRQGRYEGNEEKVDLSRKTLNMLNRFLYEDVMLAKDRYIVVHKDITWLIALWWNLPFLNIKQSGKGLYDYISILNPFVNGYFTYEPSEKLIKTYIVLWICKDEELADIFYWYEKEARDALKQYYSYLIPQYFKTLYEFFYFRDEYGRPVFKDGTPSEKYPNFSKKAEVWEQQMGLQALIIPFHQLSFERRAESNGSSWWHLKPGTLEAHLESLVQQEVNHIVTTMQPPFQEFVKELRTVIKSLAEQPILSSSGVEEEVVTEIPSHEVKARIANKLANPVHKYTARVKLVDGHEHIIQPDVTEVFRPADTPSLVQARLKHIRLRNYQEGYTRQREEVMQEITARQHELMKRVQKQTRIKTEEVEG